MAFPKCNPESITPVVIWFPNQEPNLEYIDPLFAILRNLGYTTANLGYDDLNSKFESLFPPSPNAPYQRASSLVLAGSSLGAYWAMVNGVTWGIPWIANDLPIGWTKFPEIRDRTQTLGNTPYMILANKNDDYPVNANVKWLNSKSIRTGLYPFYDDVKKFMDSYPFLTN